MRNSRGNTKVRERGGGAPWCQIRYPLQPMLEQRKRENGRSSREKLVCRVVEVEESGVKLNMGKGGRNVLF